MAKIQNIDNKCWKDVEQQKVSFVSGNGSAILKDTLVVS